MVLSNIDPKAPGGGEIMKFEDGLRLCRPADGAFVAVVNGLVPGFLVYDYLVPGGLIDYCFIPCGGVDYSFVVTFLIVVDYVNDDLFCMPAGAPQLLQMSCHSYTFSSYAGWSTTHCWCVTAS